MFLSLVRPERISSPITSSAAVTTPWELSATDMVLLTDFDPARPYPAIVRYDASSHPPKVGTARREKPPGRMDAGAGAPDRLCRGAGAVPAEPRPPVPRGGRAQSRWLVPGRTGCRGRLAQADLRAGAAHRR